jgi:hypothetical protein
MLVAFNNGKAETEIACQCFVEEMPAFGSLKSITASILTGLAASNAHLETINVSLIRYPRLL